MLSKNQQDQLRFSYNLNQISEDRNDGDFNIFQKQQKKNDFGIDPQIKIRNMNLIHKIQQK